MAAEGDTTTQRDAPSPRTDSGLVRLSLEGWTPCVEQSMDT